MHHTALVIEAQADWVTASYRGSRRILDGQDLAAGLQATELDLGGLPSRSRFQGILLQRVGRVAFGVDGDLGWLQLSGQVAADALDAVLATATKVTRLDVAATFQTPELDDTLGQLAYDQACTWSSSRAHAPRIRIQTSSDRGCTLYVGDRASNRFFRLYNKQREAEARHDEADIEHYRRCWRAELELKNSVAEPTARRLADAPDRAAYVQSTVAEYLRVHGISCAISSTGPVELVPGFRRRADVASRLSYLHTHVRPTVAQLVRSGHLSAVHEALGLTPAEVSHGS